MRQMISAAAIGAVMSLACIAGPAAAAGQHPAEATQCTNVPYSWAGTTTIGPGQSYSTGVVVPSEVGVQLAVVAFDVSTVDPAPGAVSISIGGSSVSNGAAVPGGEIAATNAGGTAVTLTRVELSIDRCYQVDSAGPVAPAAPAAETLPVMPAVPEGGLPETGQATLGLVAMAVLLIVVGGGLQAAGRRRVTARVPGR
ncbi:MAG: hypothetical protein JWM34_422 [Ilumatobacteraceae bacterium]|nr:hypothetical protein [Ilumatobacteraceae bacterium]